MKTKMFTKDYYDVISNLSSMARKNVKLGESDTCTYVLSTKNAVCKLHAYSIEEGLDSCRPTTEIVWNNIPLYGEKSKLNPKTYEMEPHSYGLYPTYIQAVQALVKKLANKEVIITSQSEKVSF